MSGERIKTPTIPALGPIAIFIASFDAFGSLEGPTAKPRGISGWSFPDVQTSRGKFNKLEKWSAWLCVEIARIISVLNKV